MTPPLRDKADPWQRFTPRHILQSAIDTFQFAYCLLVTVERLHKVQPRFLRNVQ